MIAAQTERTQGFLDPARPVNWSHPLAAGLIGFWVAARNPGWWGGQTARDAVRGGRGAHDGVLGPGTAWAGGRPHWGGPRLLTSGTTGNGFRADISNTSMGAWGVNNNAFSVAFNVLFPAVSGTGGLLAIRESTDTSAALVIIIRSAGPFTAEGYGGGTSPNLSSGLTPTANVNYTVAYTWDGSGSGTIYVYGDRALTSASNATTPQSFTAGALYLGTFGNDFSGSNCYIGQAALWGRAITPTEFRKWAALSRLGYPGLLNRLPTFGYGAPAASAFNPYYYRHLAGAG